MRTDQHGDDGEGKGGGRRDVWEDAKGDVAHEAARGARDLDGSRKPRPCARNARKQGEQHAVGGAVERPDVGGPVGVREAALEGKEAGQEGRRLAAGDDRPQRCGKDAQDDHAQGDEAVQAESPCTTGVNGDDQAGGWVSAGVCGHVPFLPGALLAKPVEPSMQ